MADKSVIIKIKRQNTPTSKAYWEEFSVPYRPNMNVISALMDIAAEPSTRDGKTTTPITYDSNCLEEVRVVRHADQWEGAHGVLGTD